MPSELLDLVDENNNLTGEKEKRSVVHARGLWHRAVHIFIFRRVGGVIEFLIHRRSMMKDQYAGCWDDKVGGHITSGATIGESVKEELEDEIGLDADGLKLIEGMWQKSDVDQEFTKTFFLEFEGDIRELKFNDGEVEEVRWMALADIRKGIETQKGKWVSTLPAFDEICAHLKEKINFVT